MGQLRNAEDRVTINEVTVSHRATKNGPHDALTWDIQGIRGVSMDGGHWLSNETTVVRSVNVTFDGVSFECDAGMLDVLADPVVRKELVEKSLAAQLEKDALEKSPHDWQEDESKRLVTTVVPTRAYQCKRCMGWVVTGNVIAKEDERDALPHGGCLGRPPTDEEKRQQDAKVAVQELGRRLQNLHERARVLLQNGAPADDVVAAFLGLSAVDEALKYTEADREVLDETETEAVDQAPAAPPTKKGKRKN